MRKKYNESFETALEDIPSVCPICGIEFDRNDPDLLEMSSFENGYKTILVCPKCNYRKVLGYQTDEDIEEEMETNEE